MQLKSFLAPVLCFLMFALVPRAEAGSGDLKQVFSNPLREFEAPSECNVVVDFYKVKRPQRTLGDPNNHYYIGAQGFKNAAGIGILQAKELSRADFGKFYNEFVQKRVV